MPKQIAELQPRTGPLASDVYLVVQKTGEVAQKRAEADFIAAASTTAASVSFAPAGNLSSVNVQAALQELDTEKVPTARTVTGTDGIGGGGALSSNQSLSLNINGLGTLASVDPTADMLAIYDASSGSPLKIPANRVPAGTGTVFRFGIDIVSPTASSGYFDLSALFGYTINSLTRVTDAASLTVAVRIGGTVVTGLSAVSASTTLTTTNATGANTVVAGNNVDWVLSGVGGVGRLWLFLNCTRT